MRRNHAATASLLPGASPGYQRPPRASKRVAVEGHKLIFSCLENLVYDIRLKGFPDLSLADVGDNQKGAKNGKGGVGRKTLSPRFCVYYFRRRSGIWSESSVTFEELILDFVGQGIKPGSPGFRTFYGPLSSGV